MTADYIALNTAQTVAERDTFTVDRYRQFGRHLQPGIGKVLDVGCGIGTGGAALVAARPEIELHGLDCLQDRLARLPHGVYSGTLCSFTTNIEAPEESFDAIVAGEFIEHLTYSDGIATLSEFRRILRPGGQVLMTTPYPDFIRLILSGRTTMGGAHVSAHYPKQLSVMMADAGFGNIWWRGSGKMIRKIGDNVPFMPLYGSFLISGEAL